MISIRSRHTLVCAAALLAVTLGVPPATYAASSYTLFESGQVRPLALSPDGLHLYACNTPDNRLEIFDVDGSGLTWAGSVPVGMEPVAVAARSNTEVWVVNHLSDSISIVDVTTSSTAHVVRTLLTGDEPRDIVFGGPLKDKAFITTAHRGQNTPLQGTIHTALTSEGIGRADVWVFDVNNLGATLGGTPLTVITHFGDTPRALAVTPNGNTVYAAVFNSGNRTTTVSEGAVCDGGSGGPACGNCVGGTNAGAICTANGQCNSNNCSIQYPGGLPAPNVNGPPELLAQPQVGLIVQFNGTNWTDELGRIWNNAVKFSLPDRDVFAIDATLPVPAESAIYTGVGTTIFNMAVNPVSGKVYVSNTEALNRVRFEGPGTFAAGQKPPGEPDTVRGHLAESRITVLDGATVTPRHLNKHIDYTTCCAANPSTENDDSLAFPREMVVSSDGLTLYVVGFGSSEVGVYDTSDLENDTFVPSAANQLPLSGLGACPGSCVGGANAGNHCTQDSTCPGGACAVSCGPTGLVLDEANSRLYVLTRFDNALSVVSTGTGMETDHLSLHNPEPASIVQGRRFNYDAAFSSSHGDSACASCHVDGDMDHLAWDLGDPDGAKLNNPGPFVVGPFIDPDFHPMKGPMTTQSLRGMANHGAMHWRGDRTGGNSEPTAQPDDGAFSEDLAFKAFNPAFEGLLGRNVILTAPEMQAYTDFILQVTYPPNPIRALDNSLTPDENAGRNIYFGPITDTFQDCNGCHKLAPEGNVGLVEKPGFFGSSGEFSFEAEPQILKVPHLRNMYQKVGMFGMPLVPFFNPGDNTNQGDQVRGFGFLHDGSTDTLFRFHNALVFNQSGFNVDGFPVNAAGDVQRRQVEAFMMAFDSNMAPIVGQQITRTSSNGGTVDPRIDLLIQRADAGECDLVVKGRIGVEDRGALYVGGGVSVGEYQFDRSNEAVITDAALRALANTAGQELTFTCVPPGSGVRIGVDRDTDGCADRDEIDAATDPADAGSTPVACTAVCASVTPHLFKRATIKDSRGRLSLTAKDVPLGSYAQESVSIAIIDGGGDIYSATQPGATIVPKGSRFKFSAPSGSTGITRVTVKENNRDPGLFKLTLKTRDAWTLGLANETEVTTEVTLNVGGQCFRGNATKVKP